MSVGASEILKGLTNAIFSEIYIIPVPIGVEPLSPQNP